VSSPLHQAPAHLKRRRLFARKLSRRGDAHAVHHHDATRDTLGEAERSLHHAGGREEIRHDERRARCDPIDDAAIVVTPAAQREAIREPERIRARGELARAL
jgi:hypothetical protein